MQQPPGTGNGDRDRLNLCRGSCSATFEPLHAAARCIFLDLLRSFLHGREPPFQRCQLRFQLQPMTWSVPRFGHDPTHEQCRPANSEEHVGKPTDTAAPLAMCSTCAAETKALCTRLQASASSSPSGRKEKRIGCNRGRVLALRRTHLCIGAS